jgi:prepilin-type processing-associated H-X9-DG protein
MANNCGGSANFWSTYPENFSCFVRLMPYLDQQSLYNQINFNRCSASAENIAICGVQIPTLVCPTDTGNDLVAFPATRSSAVGVSPGWSFNEVPANFPAITAGYGQAFTSYAGNAGTFTFGYSKLMDTVVLSKFNGTIYNDSVVKMKDITDGASNTFLFAEHSKDQLLILDPAYAVSDGSWQSGRWYDTLFATMYPMNFGYGNGNYNVKTDGYYDPTSAGSLHPGGAHFAFCDGSVRFISNSINTWSITGISADAFGDVMPDGTTFTPVAASGAFTKTGNYLDMTTGPAVLGVYQMLSTRNGGEVISGDY